MLPGGKLHINLSQWPAPYLALLFAALLVCVISLIYKMIGTLSGWHTLAGRFTAHSGPTGEVRTAGPLFCTVYFRYWSRYGGIVRVTAAQDALYLSVSFLLRFTHPTLRIPWDEIRFGKTKFLWRPYVVLTLGGAERIPMRISERMARNLGILDRC